MKPVRLIVGDRPWLLIGAVLAGVVHIVSVLAMPRLATGDAFARFARGGPSNTFRTLPPATPGAEKGPYNDPSLATGVCVYDLSQAPLRVRAALRGGTFLSISFHSRRERVYYAMTDKAATRRKFDVVVATPKQIDALKAKDNPDDPSEELRLVSPEKTGFIYVRALASDPSDMRNAEAQIAAVSCEPDQPDAQ